MHDIHEVVTVNFERYQGGFLATSPKIKGLFITHRDLARVYRAVPVAIKMFYEKRLQCPIRVDESTSLTERKPAPIGPIDYIARAA